MPSSKFASFALSRTFTEFIDSEKSGAIVLMACTVMCLLIANSAFGPAYLDFWQLRVAGLSLEHWVNGALMAIFFLLIASVCAGLLGLSWLTFMTPNAQHANRPA
jgi:Na+/H+ antiporter NhaA